MYIDAICCPHPFFLLWSERLTGHATNTNKPLAYSKGSKTAWQGIMANMEVSCHLSGQ